MLFFLWSWLSSKRLVIFECVLGMLLPLGEGLASSGHGAQRHWLILLPRSYTDFPTQTDTCSCYPACGDGWGSTGLALLTEVPQPSSQDFSALASSWAWKHCWCCAHRLVQDPQLFPELWVQSSTLCFHAFGNFSEPTEFSFLFSSVAMYMYIYMWLCIYMHSFLVSFLSFLGFVVYAHHPSDFPPLWLSQSTISIFLNDIQTISELEEESQQIIMGGWSVKRLSWGLSGKESACSAGDLDLIPGLGGSPGGKHGNSLLENPMDRGAWQDTVHGTAKSQIWLKWLGMHTHDQWGFLPNPSSNPLKPEAFPNQTLHGTLILSLKEWSCPEWRGLCSLIPKTSRISGATKVISRVRAETFCWGGKW